MPYTRTKSSCFDEQTEETWGVRGARPTHFETPTGQSTKNGKVERTESPLFRLYKIILV